MHNCFGQNVQIFLLYIYCLQEGSTHFGLGILVNFDVEVSEHFDPKKIYKKNRQS